MGERIGKQKNVQEMANKLSIRTKFNHEEVKIVELNKWFSWRDFIIWGDVEIVTTITATATFSYYFQFLTNLQFF